YPSVRCLVVHSFVLLFFFFQAEDGIRDFHVTGVQTCALPIYLRALPERPAPTSDRAGEPTCDRDGDHKGNSLVATSDRASDRPRSEERRVGKEWRSRWSPDE